MTAVTMKRRFNITQAENQRRHDAIQEALRVFRGTNFSD